MEKIVVGKMIPKIIHHVWPGEDPFKEKFHDFRKSWMDHHPDWSFYFWRPSNLPKKISANVLKIINDPNFSITPKSDILRFEIVRIFGGIYVDTDMECLKSFEDFLNNDFFSGFEDNIGTICPSLFGSVPNHPILEKLSLISAENAVNFGYKLSNKKPNEITGVLPFTETIRNYQNFEKIKICPKHFFYYIDYKERERLNETHPESYAKHYWSGKDNDGWTNTIKFA
jgi:mannosyltransferase OCH1-like enzyme